MGAGSGNLADEKPDRDRVTGTAASGAAVMWVEALRNAQEMHDRVGQAVTGAQFRDGYEALKHDRGTARGTRDQRHARSLSRCPAMNTGALAGSP